MAESAQDKHLPASARKIEKAREDGQVARSRDLGHFAAVAGGGALLVALAPALTGWLQELLAHALSFDAKSLAGTAPMLERLSEGALRMIALVLPLGAALALIAAAAGIAAGGWNWTLKAIEPKFDKFNPLTGLGRVFSWQQLGETLKACALALVLGTIGALWLRAHANDFTQLLALPLPAALSQAASSLQSGLLLLVLALAAFAAIDVPLQHKRLMDRLKMSHQELKDEMRQLEGNAEIKSKVRAMMRERAGRRMLAAVPKADIVVMNPTHYAVALRYDDKTMAAPRVVAKGAGDPRARHRAQGAGAAVAPAGARAVCAHRGRPGRAGRAVRRRGAGAGLGLPAARRDGGAGGDAGRAACAGAAGRPGSAREDTGS
jgi:flagellar biosynthesis protein FlhB